MRRLIFALALLPVAALAEQTILPGSDVVPFKCQFEMTPGYITPSDIEARDVVTGEVLYHLAAGEAATEGHCVNAPQGHGMIIDAPTKGFKKVMP